jgi:hypothetical protein
VEHEYRVPTWICEVRFLGKEPVRKESVTTPFGKGSCPKT